VHGLHVSVLHHTGKDGEIRGSSAFQKDPDVIWTLKHPSGEHAPTVRALEGLGRYDAVNTAFNIELTDKGYVILGTNGQIERAKAENRLLSVIPLGKEKAVRRTKVMEDVPADTGVSKSTVQRVLEDLLEKHYVLQEKLQEKGSPMVLWRPAFKSGPESQGTSESEEQDEESPANQEKTEGEHLFESESEGIQERDLNKSNPRTKKKKNYTLLDLARADQDLRRGGQFPHLITARNRCPSSSNG
jgi:hypothetical protein